MAYELTSDPVKIPALGRPFRLGSLYDCRNETLLTGESLWGPATLEKFTTQTMPTSKYSVEARTEYHKRAESLGLNADLSVSFLANLIEVSGSAEYLNDWYSESTNERVTVKCQTKSHSDTLTMDQLDKDKIEYPDLIPQGRATHVVTGIEYGGDAFIIFDRKISDENENFKVQGEIKAAIADCLNQDIGAEMEQKLVKDLDVHKEFISYKFHGDCQLPSNPMNFKEAIQMCKDLPTHLKESGGKPQIVSLLPLTVFNPQASRVQEAMNDIEVRAFVTYMEKLMGIEKKCENLCSIATNHQLFRSIINELESFQAVLKSYSSSLREALNDELPKVRNGKDKDRLLKFVSKYQKDICINELEKWLDESEKDIKLLIQYLVVLPDIKVCQTENDFDLLINDPKMKTMFCLMIGRPNLMESLRAGKEKKPQLDENDSADEKRAVEVIQEFSKFIEGIKKEGIGFGVFEKRASTEYITASVKKFENGHCVDSNYDMNTQPGCCIIL